MVECVGDCLVDDAVAFCSVELGPWMRVWDDDGVGGVGAVIYDASTCPAADEL